MPDIQLKRIYDSPAAGDGTRILVDRLWPRGIKKDAAQLDAWWRDLAATSALREWFGHQPERFPEFRKRYRAELTPQKAAARALLAALKAKRITLLYAARDPLHNQAVVLREFLMEIGPGQSK